MPFGFERRMQENQDPVPEEIYQKEYLDLIASVGKDSKITPLAFVWKNGLTYKIEKVLSCHSRRSLKYYTRGLRYRCRARPKDFYLYFDEDKWYVEISH